MGLYFRYFSVEVMTTTSQRVCPSPQQSLEENDIVGDGLGGYQYQFSADFTDALRCGEVSARARLLASLAAHVMG
jgi:hypothetical protein